VLASKSLNKSM